VQLGDPAFDYTAIKRAFGGLYIANGGFDADSAEAAVTSGATDLVAFGTKFLANPDLIERFRTARRSISLILQPFIRARNAVIRTIRRSLPDPRDHAAPGGHRLGRGLTITQAGPCY
jgi:2,4-dienoyl-CoA reductase-like NADH-dependent reductase (Old Yellow Enzyme family)